MDHFDPWQYASLWAGLAVVGIVAPALYWYLRRLKDKSAKPDQPTHEILSKFRNAHSEGELSDEEYRKIKTMLALRLQDELKKNSKGK